LKCTNAKLRGFVSVALGLGRITLSTSPNTAKISESYGQASYRVVALQGVA
jgi:hypothetical protein